MFKFFLQEHKLVGNTWHMVIKAECIWKKATGAHHMALVSLEEGEWNSGKREE